MDRAEHDRLQSDLEAVIRAYPILVVKTICLATAAGMCTYVGMRAGVKLAVQAIR